MGISGCFVFLEAGISGRSVLFYMPSLVPLSFLLSAYFSFLSLPFVVLSFIGFLGANVIGGRSVAFVYFGALVFVSVQMFLSVVLGGELRGLRIYAVSSSLKRAPVPFGGSELPEDAISFTET